MNSEFRDNMHMTTELFRMTDRLHRRIFEKKVASAFKLHRSQHMLLMCLSKNCGISQKEIAVRLKISPAAVAVTLNKLETAGFIKRNESKLDGRQNSIILTKKAKNVIEKTHAIFTEIDSVMVSELSEAELEIFNCCLKKMYANLEDAEQEIIKEGCCK